MSGKYTFPEDNCWNCPSYQVVGGITRYCSGFKRRKPKRFSSSDPKIKAPKWCPRRITPPIYRIYGFKDERCEYMEMLQRFDYDMGRTKSISPSAFHFKPRVEFRLGLTAKRFYDAAQEEPLRDILPEEVEIGEILEVDNGLKPYFFYILDHETVIPLPHFHLSKS